MKRFLPFALVLCSGAWIYACSSSDDSNNNGSSSDTNIGENGDGNTDPNNPSGNGDTDAGPGDDSSNPDASSGVNPIEGATAAKEPIDVIYVDGLVWKTDALYFSLPYENVVVKYTPGATPDPTVAYATVPNPLGLTFDEKANQLLVAQSTEKQAGPPAVAAAGSLKRMPAGGTPPVTPTNVAYTTDGGAPYSPNDAVVRKSDGTIYVTDPGYQAENVLNGVYRVTTGGQAIQLAAYNEERPNGIALSPDNATLYVSLTQNQNPAGTTIPSIVKFTVAADGTVGAGSKFVDVSPADSSPDGLAVDNDGNVYVATKTGVQVFARDGKKWGQIATTKQATNIAFGAADAKTLYIATMEGLFSAKVKVAGLGQ